MGVLFKSVFFLLSLSWGTMIAFCLALGLADGCFWCAEAPIAYDLVYIQCTKIPKNLKEIKNLFFPSRSAPPAPPRPWAS